MVTIMKESNIIDFQQMKRVKKIVDFINWLEVDRKVKEVLYNSLIIVTDNDYVIRLDKNRPNEVAISFDIRICTCCRGRVTEALREFTKHRNMKLVFGRCYTPVIDEKGNYVMTLLGEEAIEDYLKELDGELFSLD